MFVPGCMWHVMHWLDGIERVNVCFSGWPGSVLEIVGSLVVDASVVAERAYCAA